MDQELDHGLHIEADVDDQDSTLGADIASSTQSLQSLVVRFEYENGRRYHSFQSGSYAFPNDEDELDRMDLEHEIFLMLLDNRLHLAPLTSPQRILDVGTGTGIWAIQMADKYPSASVIGIDLSPTQPSFVPPNCEFQIDDFELEWTFQQNSFDHIHWRLLLASVSDYPKLLRQAFDHIKPGGYMEIHDIDPAFYSDDNTIPQGSSAVRWSDHFNDGCARVGRAIPQIDQYKKLMEDAGFVGVKQVLLKRPSNIWPKNKKLKRIGMVRKSARIVNPVDEI